MSLFDKVLFDWINSSGLSRSDFIAKLQMFDYENFSGLDAITLSRWINGKTTPPIYKQILIGKCLNIDLVEFIINIDGSQLRCSSKLSKVVSNFVKVLDYVQPIFSYKKARQQVKVYYDELDFQTFDMYFGDFYRNIDPLNKFISGLYELGSDLVYPAIRVLNENDEVVGHWVSVESLESLNGKYSFVSLTKKELKESCLINVCFFNSSKHYFELIVNAICNYLIMPKYSEKRFVYFFVSGYSTYEITKHAFGSEDVKYYPPTNKFTNLGVYLVKVDIIKAIANPILLPLVQEKLKCLKSCDSNCNRCNLKKYYQHLAEV